MKIYIEYKGIIGKWSCNADTSILADGWREMCVCIDVKVINAAGEG